MCTDDKHFELAKKIVVSWPEWKQKVCFAATSVDNEATYDEFSDRVKKTCGGVDGVDTQR
jgi:hypothetical protein